MKKIIIILIYLTAGSGILHAQNDFTTGTIEDQQQLLARYINSGNQNYAQGKYSEAIEDYLKAKEIYEFADLYSALCLAYCAVQNEAEAKKAYKKYKKLAPKGDDIPKLEAALNIFKPVTVDYTKIPYQPTRSFWSINYRVAPSFPVRYGNKTYSGTTLHGFSIGIMNETYKLLKPELIFAFNFGEMSHDLRNTGMSSYNSWGKESKYIYNIDIKFKGTFFSKKPQFQTGKNIVGRWTGSFGGGFGHLSNTENVLIKSYKPQEEESLGHLLGYLVNNLSYEVTWGVFLSHKDKPLGIKIELFAAGYWQFKSQYKMTGIHSGILIGCTLGKADKRKR
jgi:tetratricopeptide (TPR) repeat protein